MPRRRDPNAGPRVPKHGKLVREMTTEEFTRRFPQVAFRISPELEGFLEWLILTDPLIPKETSVNLLIREALIHWILDKKRLRLAEYKGPIPEIDDKLR